jgi:hypothetical protein
MIRRRRSSLWKRLPRILDPVWQRRDLRVYYDKELDDMEEPWKAFQKETEQFWQEMDVSQKERSGHKMHLKN